MRPCFAARWLVLCCLGCALPGLLQAARSPGDWPDNYDKHFRKYSKYYFGPNFDWHWFKAQGIAESGLKPDAKSHVGAVGVMQILPATFKDIKKRNPFVVDIHDPRWNIAAGIFYDRYLYRRWKDRLARRARIPATFASYNAGLGRINKAYRLVKKKRGKVRGWPDMEPHTPKQTRNYVRRIAKLRGEITRKK